VQSSFASPTACLAPVHDAEDIVQEAFIRWMNTDRSDIRERNFIKIAQMGSLSRRNKLIDDESCAVGVTSSNVCCKSSLSGFRRKTFGCAE
jgi:hypothetical protein